MALIASPEEATPLARELVADIERYNATRSDCELAIPAGGADRVKVATRLSRPGTLSFEGLEIRIEK